MALDPRVKRFLDALAAGKPPNALTTSVERRREAFAALMRLAGAAPAGDVEERTISGPGGPIAVRIAAPAGMHRDPLPGLVYFHGGGLVAGSVATHAPIASALAYASHSRIVSVEYRLAPEHRFPAAVEDALAAVRHVGEHADDFGIDARRLGVCGDSAGGTLAAAACRAIASEGGPPLALQVLICPILDHSRPTESRQRLARGYLIDQETLEHDLLHYLPAGQDPADPRVSPLRAADLAGVPPTIVHTAEYDPLRDEGRLYYERLAQLGSALSYTCHAGMIHMFYGLGAVIPYAGTALAQIGAGISAAWESQEKAPFIRNA